MPRHSANILELARRGAEQRYAELKTEIAALVRDFPHLVGRGAGRRPSAASDGTAAPTAGRRRRRRAKMSAAARKAVSERMKKYWATRRGAKQK